MLIQDTRMILGCIDIHGEWANTRRSSTPFIENLNLEGFKTCEAYDTRETQQLKLPDGFCLGRPETDCCKKSKARAHSADLKF